MNKDQAREIIKRQVDCRQFLKKSKGGLYCCPECGSGDGHNGTGAVKYYQDTNTCYCHACKASFDVIDLYQRENGTDYPATLEALAQLAGVEIDHEKAHTPKTQNLPSKTDFTTLVDKVPTENAQRAEDLATEAPQDYTAYYNECRKRIHDPAAESYLAGRGISTETAARYWIGYDPAADPAGNPGGAGESKHPTPRIIIPTTTGHYVGRSIDPNTPPGYRKMNNKGGHPGIFNERVLYAQDVQEVFIVEGAFDALSILEAGSSAIALNSTSNADALIKNLERKPTTATLILCLDNDDAGKKATTALRQGLQRLNTSHIVADICGGFKDPNEYLQADRAGFTEAIEAATRKAAARPDNTADYIAHLMGSDIEQFKSDTKTGFSNLDKKAGGLYAGLYAIAAISSLGKTTFAAQIADQIAAAGQEVIFFSLEQSRLEMVSKSIARITAELDTSTAVTSLQIRKGYGGKAAQDAAREYVKRTGDRISIVEGNFSCNISFIGDYIRQYIRRNNVRPVVFIDYLQILQPETVDNRKQSTKEMVDTTITELKRISREMNLTVFIISSVNRANYLTPIDFESLKESGGIEYTCDVVWGLQFQCLNESLFSEANKIKEKRARIKNAKDEKPARKIELCCLKNRYGIANFSCYFDYYPANDLFRPNEPAPIVDAPARQIKRI